MMRGGCEMADGGGAVFLDDGSKVLVGGDNWQWFLQC
jgi:hypothetical protein